MTKPGNSDPVEPTADQAPEPSEPTTEPASEPEANAEPEPATPEAADSGESEKAAEEKAAEPKPAAEKPARAKRAAKPVDPEPLMAELEKAPPPPREEALRAKRAAKPVDPEPLMAELEKAPPPPREETLRAKRGVKASGEEEALRAQAKRRFEEPAPRALRFSFYFFTAAGLVWLASMVASLIFKQDIINAQIKNNTNTKITPDQISSAVTQILWIVTVASLAFTVLLALFGYKATEGTRRARTLVTIFSVIMVLFHLLLNGTQPGILSAFLSLIGLALLWSPSARRYFPPRQLP